MTDFYNQLMRFSREYVKHRFYSEDEARDAQGRWEASSMDDKMDEYNKHIQELKKTKGKYFKPPTPVLPGAHDRIAQDAIAKAESQIGKTHTIDASDMVKQGGITGHIGRTIHGEQISGETNAKSTLDEAKRKITDLGKAGKMFHPAMRPALDKIDAAHERLFPEEYK